jgi:hypothetical protein
MINAIRSLNPVAVIVVSILGFLIGGLWYSPLLFVKAWMAEVKMTPEIARAAGNGKSRLAGALLLTLVSTTALAALLAAHRVSGPLKGAETGLFVGAALVAAREAANNLFELRSFRYFLIVSGHDMFQFTVLGAVLAVWR